MRILVTGGAGFIGGNFIRSHLQTHPQDELCCLDSLTYAGDFSALAPMVKKGELRFIKGDICDRETVLAAVRKEKPDVVVNFAAESHVDRSIRSPEPFFRTNVLGTAVLLDACLKCGARFHQISTDEVYGSLPPEAPPVSEQANLAPSSPYAASKASADLVALSYFTTYGLPVTVTRASNNYGAYQFPEKLIPLAIVSVLQGKPVPVYGNGKNIRNWLHVGDHCRAIEIVLEKGKAGEVYNVGGSAELCNLEVIEKIVRLLQRGETVFVADRKGHDFRYAISDGKLRALGYAPAVGFDEGLKETVEWYLENEPRWRAILSGEYRSAYERFTDGKL